MRASMESLHSGGSTGSDVQAVSDAASAPSSPGVSPREVASLRQSMPEQVGRGQTRHGGRPRMRSDPTRTQRQSRQSPMAPPPAPRGHATTEAPRRTPDDDPWLDHALHSSTMDFDGNARTDGVQPPPPGGPMAPEAMSIQAMYDRIRLLENEYIEGTGNHNVRHWNAETIQAQCAELERSRPPAPDADQMLQSRGSAGASKSPPREFWDPMQADSGEPHAQLGFVKPDCSLSDYSSDTNTDSMPSSPRSARSVGSGGPSAFGSVKSRKPKGSIGRSRSKGKSRR